MITQINSSQPITPPRASTPDLAYYPGLGAGGQEPGLCFQKPDSPCVRFDTPHLRVSRYPPFLGSFGIFMGCCAFLGFFVHATRLADLALQFSIQF
jgi:hypothetical protein